MSCRCDPRSLPEKRSARKVRLHTSLDAMTAAALAGASAAAAPRASALDPGPLAGERGPFSAAPDASAASANDASDAQPSARELEGLA